MARQCYAAPLGDCAAKYSREHYISRAVLKEMGKPIIFGLQRGPSGPRPITSLTAHVLCERHNNELSELDHAALRAFRGLRAVQNRFDDGAKLVSQPSSFTIDGPLFERWMLKVAFGLAAAGQLGSRVRATQISELRHELRLLCVLFGEALWPQHWGLYCNIIADQPFAAPTASDGGMAEFGVEPLCHPTTKVLMAFRVWIRSFPFLLAFGRPDDLDPVMYRPAALVVRRRAELSSSALSFGWHDRHGHASIHLTRIGTLSTSVSDGED